MTQLSTPASADSDAQRDWLARVGAERDRAAFRMLFDHFAPRIRAFLVSRRVPPSQADDMTQDVLLAVWRRAESYDPAKAAPSTWVFTIARNVHIDQFRKAKREQRLDDHGEDLKPEAPPAAEELYERSEAAAGVARALVELPPDQRSVLEMAFREGQSHSDIAARLGLPLGTVKSRIRLAMRKLKVTLGDSQ
ncbi:sigma-70 family RNA polymerase sigma factor [Maricaulis sp. CAU 1757]